MSKGRRIPPWREWFHICYLILHWPNKRIDLTMIQKGLINPSGPHPELNSLISLIRLARRRTNDFWMAQTAFEFFPFPQPVFSEDPSSKDERALKNLEPAAQIKRHILCQSSSFSNRRSSEPHWGHLLAEGASPYSFVNVQSWQNTSIVFLLSWDIKWHTSSTVFWTRSISGSHSTSFSPLQFANFFSEKRIKNWLRLLKKKTPRRVRRIEPHPSGAFSIRKSTCSDFVKGNLWVIKSSRLFLSWGARI